MTDKPITEEDWAELFDATNRFDDVTKLHRGRSEFWKRMFYAMCFVALTALIGAVMLGYQLQQLKMEVLP